MSQSDDELTYVDLQNILKYSPGAIEREVAYRILLKKGLLP